MDTQLVKQNVQLSQWAGIIRDRNMSGQTISSYCSCHGITENQYYYWLRKLRTAAMDTCAIEFEEIIPPKEASKAYTTKEFQTQMQLQIGDIKISVNESTPKELLHLAMEVAKHVE